MRGFARELAAGLRDLLFSPVCLFCDGPAGPGTASLCAACWSRAPELPRPRCERCWSPHPPAPTRETIRTTCPTCGLLPPYLRAVRSGYLLDGPARRLVHALKYEGWHSAADPMAARMAALPLPMEVAEEVGLVVAVPTAAVRVRQRGYNQAELLARAYARLRDWPDRPDVLQRTRPSGTQTTLHPDQRRANVAGAFRVRPGCGPDLKREHVLLVDDVWTTGATALACATALIEAGARAVSAVTFARALPGPKH